MLNRKIDNPGVEVHTLASKVGSVEEGLGTLTDRVGSVEDSLSTLTDRVGSVEEGLGALADKFDDLGVEVHAQSVSIHALTGRVDSLEKLVIETKAVVDGIFAMLDKDSVLSKGNEVEIGALKSQTNRHDRWINRAGKKIGIAQEYA